VALVSVITSGVVAVAVPLVTARLQRSQRSDDRRAERFDELRSVVDAASVALAHAESALRALEAAIERESRDASTEAAAAQTDVAIGVGEDAIRGVEEASHRAAVRLGWTTEPCQLYGAALKDLGVEFVTLVDVRDGGPSADDLEAWAEVVHSLQEIHARYTEHRVAFYAAASQLVGPDA